MDEGQTVTETRVTRRSIIPAGEMITFTVCAVALLLAVSFAVKFLFYEQGVLTPDPQMVKEVLLFIAGALVRGDRAQAPKGESPGTTTTTTTKGTP